MIVAKQGIHLLPMLTARRHFALLFLSLFIAAPFARSAPSAPTDATKLTLNDAIQRALEKNFAIKVEGYNASIASARVTESLGKFDPVLSGSYNNADNYSPQLIDLEFVQWVIEESVPFALVFSKADLVKAGALQKNIGLFQEKMEALGMELPRVFTASSKTKSGRQELLGFIRETLGQMGAAE